MSDSITVSICTLTYNHAPYIRQCLDGFLMQQCDFDFEVLIHDDASTDGTADIIREYEAKYPDIIKPIYQTENQYSKGVGVNRVFNFPRAKGKYIALCEGDDYWIDPLKLQKQVEFLESNPKYSLCFTNAEVTNSSNTTVSTDLFTHLRDVEYTGNEILARWTIPTASVIFRNLPDLAVPVNPRFIFGDIVLFLGMAERGKLWCINEKTVVYRRHNAGVVLSFQDYFNKYTHHMVAIVEVFGDKYRKTVFTILKRLYYQEFFAGRLGKKSRKVVRLLAADPRLFFSFMVGLPKESVRVVYRKLRSSFDSNGRLAL